MYVNPEEIENPKWEEAGRVHDWRNYASDRIKELWQTFTKEQKIALAESFDDVAGREHWD